MMTLDLLCLGEPLIELNAQADGLYRRGFGGDVANCAVAAMRSGARAGLLAQIGADGFGDAFMELWAAEGVDVAGVTQRADAPTGVYIVEHGPDGHRFSYLRAGSAASRMTVADAPLDQLPRARALHLSGISQAIGDGPADAAFAAMERMRAQGGLISYDTNLRLSLWPLARARAVIHAAAAQADILLPGLDDAQALTGLQEADAIVDFYLALGPKTVALTLGADGVLVATPDRRERIAPWSVNAVDATGAGDTFDGAFLAAYLRDADPFAAARYANAAAAIAVQGYGAVAPMPTRAAVEALLATA